MPDIFQKERAIVTLSSAIASMTSGSAAVANATADFDARSGGNAPQDICAVFEWLVQWATVTGIVAGTVVGELYLVPILDGTNLPEVDLTSGSSRLPLSTYVSPFEAPRAPTANTNARFVSWPVYFNPLLYRPYVLNRSGQTTTANSTLRVVTVRGQYA